MTSLKLVGDHLRDRIQSRDGRLAIKNDPEAIWSEVQDLSTISNMVGLIIRLRH